MTFINVLFCSIYFAQQRRPRSSTREERLLVDADQRTVLCMQLSQRVSQRDLETFFGAIGKVREVRLIVDNKTRRHKGVAYIEFREPESVPLALALHGQKLGGYPIQIQPTHAQKNRPNAVNNTPANPPADPISHPPIARRHFPNMPAAVAMRTKMPMLSSHTRLYVGSLHFHITEDMLRSIFEPFGAVNKIELIREPETQRSKGYGFVTFVEPDGAKRAIDQLNGFDLAGRPMKVNHANERNVDIAAAAAAAATLDSNYIDMNGVDLKASNRMHLMAKLAEGTGMQVPQMSTSVLFSRSDSSLAGTIGTSVESAPAPAIATEAATGDQPVTEQNSAETANYSIATQCFLLSNMFDPNSEQGDVWHEEIRTDVVDECRQHGGALHAFVDRLSAGNVYIKCASRHVAAGCVSALHGRWFSGRLVTAAYIPEEAYHQLFPESATATQTL
jgi:RNA-binding protein 39